MACIRAVLRFKRYEGTLANTHRASNSGQEFLDDFSRSHRIQHCSYLLHDVVELWCWKALIGNNEPLAKFALDMEHFAM
jgi:hypothetical protein